MPISLNLFFPKHSNVKNSDITWSEFLTDSDTDSHSEDESKYADNELIESVQSHIEKEKLLAFYRIVRPFIDKFNRSQEARIKVKGRQFTGHAYPKEFEPIIALQTHIRDQEDRGVEVKLKSLQDYQKQVTQTLLKPYYKFNKHQQRMPQQTPLYNIAHQINEQLKASPLTVPLAAGKKTLSVTECPFSKDLLPGDIMVFIELRKDPDQDNRPPFVGPGAIPSLQAMAAPSSQKDISLPYGHASEVHVAMVVENNAGYVKLAESGDFSEARFSFLHDRLRNQPAEIFRFKDIELRQQIVRSANHFVSLKKIEWGGPFKTLFKRAFEEQVSLVDVHSVDNSMFEQYKNKLLCVQFANLVLSHAMQQSGLNNKILKTAGLMTKDFASWLKACGDCDILFMPRIKSSEFLAQYREITLEPAIIKILSFFQSLLEDAKKQKNANALKPILETIMANALDNLNKKFFACHDNVVNNTYPVLPCLKNIYVLIAQVNNKYPEFSKDISKHLKQLKADLKHEHGIYSEMWSEMQTLATMTADEINNAEVTWEQAHSNAQARQLEQRGRMSLYK